MKHITIIVTKKQAEYLQRWADEAASSADTLAVSRDAARLAMRIEKAVAAALAGAESEGR